MTTIVRLTLLEALRRRLLWALVGLTVVLVLLTGWGVALLVANARSRALPEPQIELGVSQVVILLAFMYSFVLAMTAAFLGAPALAADVESGIAQTMLARPLRRSELVTGRWVGLAIVIAGYAAIGGGLELVAVWLVSGYVPPGPVAAIAYLAAEAIVLLTVALLLSARLPAMAGGAIAVVLFGLSWIAGVLGGIASVLRLGDLELVTDVARLALPLDGLWRGVIFHLEPQAALFLLGQAGAAGGTVGSAATAVSANPFFAAAPPATTYLIWAVAWVAIGLGAAIALFRSREL
jgi:ABC-type transport system involved in multi-copper enzyme maturation permease subunit